MGHPGACGPRTPTGLGPHPLRVWQMIHGLETPRQLEQLGVRLPQREIADRKRLRSIARVAALGHQV